EPGPAPGVARPAGRLVAGTAPERSLDGQEEPSPAVDREGPRGVPLGPSRFPRVPAGFSLHRPFGGALGFGREHPGSGRNTPGCVRSPLVSLSNSRNLGLTAADELTPLFRALRGLTTPSGHNRIPSVHFRPDPDCGLPCNDPLPAAMRRSRRGVSDTFEDH